MAVVPSVTEEEPESSVPDDVPVVASPGVVAVLLPCVVFTDVPDDVVFSGVSPQATEKARTQIIIAAARRKDKIFFIFSPYIFKKS